MRRVLSLSVIIIAKNEAANISRCLESVKWADEIIVLDSGSIDETIALAKQYTPHVFSTDWQGYGVQKQRALAKATCDWVLNLDADEYVSDDLKQSLLDAMQSNTADAYKIPIQLNFYGQTLKYASSPSRHIRLFKREGAVYSDDIVHEKVLVPPSFRVQQLTFPILHHSFQDLTHALEKLNRYSSYSAKIRLHDKKHAHIGNAIFGFMWMFFRCYVLQRGFLDGKMGFLLSFYAAEGSFYRAMKQIYPDVSMDNLPKVGNGYDPHETA